MQVTRLQRLDRGNPSSPRKPRKPRKPREQRPAASTRWLAAAVVPALLTLAACGGDADADADAGAKNSADSAYCSALSDAQEHFATFQAGEVEKFDEAFAAFHQLAGESPKEIEEDWLAFDGALADLEDGLAAIGLKVSDLADVTEGEVPPGADAGDLAKVPDLMLALVSDEFIAAATDIERHAIEECDIELAA